jgi:hypothetical protein
MQPDKRKIVSNAPKLDDSITDKSADEIEHGIESELEDLDEKTRRQQRIFPDRQWSSNAPDLDTTEDFDPERTRRQIEDHLETWDGRQDENVPEMAHGEQASNAPKVTNRDGDVSDSTGGYQDRVQRRLEQIDEDTRADLRDDSTEEDR